MLINTPESLRATICNPHQPFSTHIFEAGLHFTLSCACKRFLCVSLYDFSHTVIAIKPKAHFHVRLAELHVYVLLVCNLRGPSFSGFSGLGACVCERDNGDRFHSAWFFGHGNSYEAEDARRLTETNVSICVLLLCDLRGLSSRDLFFAAPVGTFFSLWGCLGACSREDLQISHTQSTVLSMSAGGRKPSHRITWAFFGALRPQYLGHPNPY